MTTNTAVAPTTTDTSGDVITAVSTTTLRRNADSTNRFSAELVDVEATRRGCASVAERRTRKLAKTSVPLKPTRVL